MRKASPASARKDKEKTPPFSTAPENWSRAVFEHVRLSGKGVGGAGGPVPRVAISHGTMRRLRLAVGEEVLLMPEQSVRTKLGVGEARADGEDETLQALLARAAQSGEMCSALAWPSAATAANAICVSDGTLQVLGLQDKDFVVLCRRSAVDSQGTDSSYAPALSQAWRLILAPLEGEEWQGAVGAGNAWGTSRAAAAVLLSQLVGRVVCGGMCVSISLHGRPLVLKVQQVHSATSQLERSRSAAADTDAAENAGALHGLAIVTRDTCVTLAPVSLRHSHADVRGGRSLEAPRARDTAGDGCHSGASREREGIADDSCGGAGKRAEGVRHGERELRQVLQEVGGCEEAARALVDALCGALLLAHEYEGMGLAAPRGVLLYGPPGTGKTLLSCSAAKAMGALFLCVDAPELVGGLYGDSERRISELFATARAAPAAVIFIDEIDVVCGQRASAGGELERRIVASLIHHLDSLGRTNVLLGKLPSHVSEEDRQAVASRLHGCVGADIKLVVASGCSKTLMAKALATEAGLNFLAVKGPELFRKYVGDSEKAVAAVFRKARMAAPAVIFFDEIDSLAPRRSSSGEGSAGQRVVSQLLNEMDGVEPLKQVVVVAATNRPDLLDAAFLRPGRIDRLIYVEPPDKEARKQVLAIHLRKMPLAPDVDLEVLAGKSEGFSGAELANVCREAGLVALAKDSDSLDMQSLEEAMSKCVKRITPEMLAFYQNFQISKSVSI